MRPERRAQPGDQGEGVGDAVPHVGHGGEDVGGSGDRRQSHPPHATHLVGGPLSGCAMRSPGRGGPLCRASGVVTARLPVSSGAKHGRGRADDEKVSTPVGEQPTRDGAGGRDVSRGVPGRTRRDDRAARRAGDRRAAARPSGQRRRPPPGRPPRRGAGRPDPGRPAARRPGRPPAGARRARPPGRTPARPRRRPPRPAAAGRAAARCPSAPRPPGGLGARQPAVPPQRPDPAAARARAAARAAERTGSAVGTRRAPERPPTSPGRRRLGRVAHGARRRRRRRPALPPGPLLLRRPEDRPGRRPRHRRSGGPGARAAGRRGELPRRRHAASPGRTGRPRWPRCWPRSPPTATGRCWSASRRRRWSTPPSAARRTGRCAARSPRPSPSSLLDGGPSCMVRAVQQLSGLRVDHYLDVDLARLPGMVDALGGVPGLRRPVGGHRRGGAPAAPTGSSELTGDAGHRLPAARATRAPTSPGPRSPSGPSGC